MHERLRSPAFAALLLAALVFAAYLPALPGEFLWDDDVWLENNPHIRAPDGLLRYWISPETPDYFPVTSSSFWIGWRLWGTNPIGYHVENVILHVLASLGIWAVLRRLGAPAPWFAAALFAIHPVNVASVAWIAERKNGLSLLFSVAAGLAYLRFDPDLGADPAAAAVRPRRRWYALALVAFALALLSKTTVVMLPFVLLGIAGARRGALVPRDLVHTAPFFALSLALGIVTLRFHRHRAIGETMAPGASALERVADAGRAVWFYLGKALWPADLVVVVPRWPDPASTLTALAPGVALVLVLAALFVLARRGPGPGLALARSAFLGLAFFVTMLLPVLGLVAMSYAKHSPVADHYQYPAILGVLAIAAAAGSRLPRRPALALAVLALATLGTLTWRQASLYRSPEVLWTDTVRRNPEAWIAQYNLGTLLAQRGPAEFERAKSHLARALQIRPDYAEAHANLGLILARQGRDAEADEHYAAAIAIEPADPIIHYNRGLSLARLGNAERAISHFHRAVALEPSYADAHVGLAVAAARLGDRETARRHLEIAIRLEPDHPLAGRLLESVPSPDGRPDAPPEAP